MKRVLVCLLVLMTVSCASGPKEPVSRAHRATVVNDLFAVEQGMPIREVRKNQDFFFKKCEVSNFGRPYFSKTEYECTDSP